MTMNRTLLKKVSIELMAWAGVAVLCSVVALAQDAGAPTAPSQGQPAAQSQEPRTDGQIEMDVVHALDASQALKNDLITAATIQSEVTLSGTVSSQASKQLAESIASHVPGVTKVHNNLTVGNPQDAQAMQPAPDSEAQEMPGNPQAGNGTAGVPPPGPAPEQNPPQASSYPAQAPYPQQHLIRSSRPIRRSGLRTRIHSMGNIRRSTRPRRQRRPMCPPRGL